ncbi:NADH-ubiquinone oxidoreductase-F iron-sulfur binding region domain-containing protein [Arthrobacter sp. zg-Y1219]|uniref:NADH-ubiquinone oxidoreductase-F iron-sulfur binding region domain-containing protein n=1 Tax=Arthrobacter sp. zg-Y1219 TaxID=3049067 RepID=UPI0024C329C5|nr:NADH-ubiquinone oxidoreductase-F iron-sulfur binding region domain-containing protein [Arthrobacter sp. zg-Y1219]MDK1361109.1 NADH-ubiquinone oxidoreductase-F iron-sulfur binding region domain-containing protein [Arthrobacter sp. zg-Y1219]
MSAPAGTTVGVPVAVYPAIEPRLLRLDGAEDVNAYLDGGGYAPLLDPDALLDQVTAAGLRGRGGAAFPLARKITTVRGGSVAPVVIANGEEGEPSSVKDKWLLRNRPHLVLDGLRLAAVMAGAERAYVYLSDPLAADSIERALLEYPGRARNGPDITVHRVSPAYVAGEETAAVRSLNGGPALPSDKPPRPFERGVDDRPTQVSNVETLSNLPLIHARGSAWYRSVGTDDSTGTYLMTLSTSGGTVLAEVPFGVTLREVLTWRGHDAPVTGALMGGYFAGLLSSRVLDLPLEYVAVAAAGSGLGCGAVGVLDEHTCPVTVAGGVLQYFAANNAGQCGSCFNGTAAMAAVVTGLRLGRAREPDIDRLRQWAAGLRGRGACGTLDGATNAAATLLREFPDAVESHLIDECSSCITKGEHLPAPFAVHGY